MLSVRFPAALPKPSPAAAASTVRNIMIAITHGIGPASRPSGSSRRSAAPNLRTPPFMPPRQSCLGPPRRVAQRAGGIEQLAAVELQHLEAPDRRDEVEVV